MAEINAVGAACPLLRAVMHSEGHGVALREWNHFGARLHARALLGQYELATGEIATGLGQEDRDLEREHVLAIEILMQAVEIAGLVLQQQRRRPRLPGLMAALQERRVFGGVADVDPHRLVPAIGDALKL